MTCVAFASLAFASPVAPRLLAHSRARTLTGARAQITICGVRWTLVDREPPPTTNPPRL